MQKLDVNLFNLSVAEATAMDPQQRVLLEVAYAALYDAGEARDTLTGRPVAVHIGIDRSYE